ncbi:hypothetical protein NAS2_1601 [Conexivisphaera calida]|uniref:Uncharacterized protein n=1 Tax=Conexivisphaera calida TaxID=1874277 RepID=A0A4P2VGH3_9ARCH|nr:hypothetical protein NAS2_1601 [Conexivisphaera calida]
MARVPGGMRVILMAHRTGATLSARAVASSACARNFRSTMDMGAVILKYLYRVLREVRASLS